MKRNVHSTSDTAKACLEKLTCNEYYMKTVMAYLQDIKSEMKQFTYHCKMETVDIAKYFPLDNDEDMAEFMDRDDGQWDLRRKAFYHLLFTTITEKKNKFAGALLTTLFTRNFIKNHKWPGLEKYFFFRRQFLLPAYNIK